MFMFQFNIISITKKKNHIQLQSTIGEVSLLTLAAFGGGVSGGVGVPRVPIPRLPPLPRPGPLGFLGLMPSVVLTDWPRQLRFGLVDSTTGFGSSSLGSLKSSRTWRGTWTTQKKILIENIKCTGAILSPDPSNL